MLAGCGNGSGPQKELPPDPPAEPVVTVSADIKQLMFSWAAVPDVSYYKLMENPDGHSGFTQVGENIPAGTLSVDRDIVVHLFDWVDAQYMVEACNVTGCSNSDVVTATNVMLETILSIDGYTDPHLSGDGQTMAVTGDDGFYILRSVENDWDVEHRIGDVCPSGSDRYYARKALSTDGNTLAVTCPDFPSFLNSRVYIYRFNGSSWSELTVLGGVDQVGEFFGSSVALSGDGNVLAVGAKYADNNPFVYPSGDFAYANGSGAVYIYRFDGTEILQEALLKPQMSGPRPSISPEETFWTGINFGNSLSLSDDGRIIAIGAKNDSSSSIGVGGSELDNCGWDRAWTWQELSCAAPFSGAAYVFAYDGSAWTKQAYIKASNPQHIDGFGHALHLSGNGRALAVGAPYEDKASTGVDGDQSTPGRVAYQSGAVYVFHSDGADWSQQAYVKASNSRTTAYADLYCCLGLNFGRDIELSTSGEMLAVGAPGEDSNADGVNGDQNDDTAWASGAVYVFRLKDSSWVQESYVKDPNSRLEKGFGRYLSISGDGTVLVVEGAQRQEDFSSVPQVLIY
jgi:hypothetical protein